MTIAPTTEPTTAPAIKPALFDDVVDSLLVGVVSVSPSIVTEATDIPAIDRALVEVNAVTAVATVDPG